MREIVKVGPQLVVAYTILLEGGTAVAAVEKGAGSHDTFLLLHAF